MGISISNQLLGSTGLSAGRGLSRGSGLSFDGFPVPSLYLPFALSGTLDPRITFSRPSHATLYDSTGNVTYAPNNLYTYSEQFNNAAWGLNAATIAANVIASPTGEITADKIQETAVTNFFAVIQNPTGVVSTKYVWSCYAKAAERNFLALNLAVSGPTGTWNLTTGVNNITGGIATSATAVFVGDGWWRLSVSFNTPSSGANLLYGVFGPSSTNSIASYAGTAGFGIYVWGAQLEAVSYQITPRTYVATTSAVYYGPRFDYDPTTLAAKGLLIEEARTNICLQSKVTSAGWVGSSATIATDNATAPDGTTSAARVTAIATSDTYIYSSSFVTTAAATTHSVYAKAGTSNWIWMRPADNSVGVSLVVFFDLSNGVVGSLGTGCTGTITSAGNGWYRCTVTKTITAGTGYSVIGACSGDATLAVANGSTVYLWGAQVEVGAFASSYIPTAASAVTRSRDDVSMTGTNFSSWYSQSEGTFAVEYATDKVGGGVVGTYQSPEGSIRVTKDVGSYFLVEFPVGTYTVALPFGAPSNNNKIKFAAAYKLNDFAISQDGASVLTDNSSGVPSNAATLYIGSVVTGVAYLNGTIKSLTYYNTRLPNATLQSLTT